MPQDISSGVAFVSQRVPQPDILYPNLQQLSFNGVCQIMTLEEGHQLVKGLLKRTSILEDRERREPGIHF